MCKISDNYGNGIVEGEGRKEGRKEKKKTGLGKFQ